MGRQEFTPLASRVSDLLGTQATNDRGMGKEDLPESGASLSRRVHTGAEGQLTGGSSTACQGNMRPTAGKQCE